jgi:hypothetical protein
MNPEELIVNYPVLFHMAHAGAWSSIREHGLLSTDRLVRLYDPDGTSHDRIVSRHRPEIVSLVREGLGVCFVRDQKPMRDQDLIRCLRDNLTPSDWYRILNQRVFFWLSAHRLEKLLGARAYRSHFHDVLYLDTASLVRDYEDLITLSPINSGATRPIAVPRGRDTFRRIEEYDFNYWKKKRTKRNAVVELAVTGGVSDIERYVFKVERRKFGTNATEIWRGSYP